MKRFKMKTYMRLVLASCFLLHLSLFAESAGSKSYYEVCSTWFGLFNMAQSNGSQILGVRADASAREIRQAYRRQALKYHPDKQQSNTTQSVESIEEQFIAIADAYAVLSDDEARQKYDSGNVR